MENMMAKMMAQYPDDKKMWEMVNQIRMQNTQTTSDKVEYECSLCKDTRGLSRVDHEGRRRWRDCDCVLREVSLRRIEKSGLAYAIDSYTFDDYISIENWQRDVKSKAMEFAENDAPLFFAGGQVGSGKTHICTAIAGELLKTKALRYMLWRDESVKLKACVTDYEQYQRLIVPFKKTYALYIDDFWKTPKTSKNNYPTDADITLAFEIINHRYSKPIKTIISSEFCIEDILLIDEAVGSRIKHMAGKYCINVAADKNRNYRLVM